MARVLGIQDGEDLTGLFNPVKHETCFPVAPVELVSLSEPEALKVEAWTDGGCRGNPGPAGWGVHIRHGRQTVRLKGTLPRATNNEAEYAGLLACLRWAVEHRVSQLTIHSDSEVMVRQIQGRYGVRGKLKPLYLSACALMMDLGNGAVVLRHVRREQNKDADRLATQAMDEAGFPRQTWPKRL